MEEKITKEPAQSQRRGLLRKAFWMVAGVVGAGSLLGAKAAPAHATGSEGPTTFTATGGATAISAQSESGVGLIGFSESGAGVVANSHTGYGLSAASGTGVSVEAYSTSVVAVDARSNTGTGLHAFSNGIGAILENPRGVAVQVKGRIQVQGDCIGQAILRGGWSSVVVNAPAATPDSLILLTTLYAQYWDGVLSASDRKTGSFTITSTKVPQGDLGIGYLIVN